jgi:CRP-like cAMP-binding protein
MSIETERLKISPHQTLVDAQGRFLIERAGHAGLVVPDEFRDFWQLTGQGFTLAQMAQRMRIIAGAGRFASLARYLIFLSDQDLLGDRNAIRLADALRADYTWSSSVAFTDIFSLGLVRLGKTMPLRRTSQWMWALALLALSLFLVSILSQTSIVPIVSEASEPRWGGVAASLLWAFLLTFAAGRSLREYFQFLNIRWLTGFDAGLRIRCDAVSISLSTDDHSQARGGAPFLVAAFAALLLTGFFPAMTRVFKVSDDIAIFVPYFTMLLFLADLSPFRKSALTDWLRTLYNTADRAAEKTRSVRPPLEKRLRLLQMALSILWITCLAAFIAGPSRGVFSYLRGTLHWNAFPVMACALILGLLQLMIFVSFIDDIFSYLKMAFGSGGTVSQVRRLWRRRRPGLLIDEAIRQGQSLSRVDLEKLPVLRQLAPDIRARLLARAEVEVMHEGETVCSQGDQDRTLFVVLSGRLAVSKNSKNARRRVVALLDPGAVFGEVAFFFGQPRTADVIAMEESRVLAVRYDETLPNSDQAHTGHPDEVGFRIWFLQAIVGNEYFRELPSEALDALVFSGQKQLFKAGEKVIQEGVLGDACYFLIQGRASVMQNLKLINRLKAGDIFGEISLLRPGTLRTATIMADSDILTMKIEAEKFWALISDHLPLALEIERQAEKRLRKDFQKELQKNRF